MHGMFTRPLALALILLVVSGGAFAVAGSAAH